MMIIERRSKLEKYIACTLGVCLCAVLQVSAQGQRGGGGGGFGGVGGGGGGRGLGTAGSTSRTYYNNGTVGEAMISSDPETRRLIVITDEETSQYVSQVVSNLDRPKPQVLIKVVFLEVTHNDSLDIGIEGGYKKNFLGSSTGAFANIFGLSGLNNSATGGVINALGQNLGTAPNAFTTAPPGGGGLYQIMGTDYQATLRAIAAAGKTEVLSRPSILARNNQPATITVGQSVPLVTAVTFGGLNNTPVSAISYQSVGIILKVTPFINSENMVEMIVSPQISELADSQVNVTAGITSPIINLRSADTVVVTPDGQTVIIGGLMQKTKQKAESKVPILGDIPLLGNLFKHKTKNDSRTELIIFLTPHIVMAPSQLAGLSRSERSQAHSELPTKLFTDQELDEFLDGLPSKTKNGKKAPNSSTGPVPNDRLTPGAEEKARELLNPPNDPGKVDK